MLRVSAWGKTWHSVAGRERTWQREDEEHLIVCNKFAYIIHQTGSYSSQALQQHHRIDRGCVVFSGWLRLALREAATLTSRLRSKCEYCCIHRATTTRLTFALSVSLEGNRPRKPFQALLDDPLLAYSGQYRSQHSDLLVGLVS